MMPQDAVEHCLRLLHAGMHGVTVEQLNASASVSGDIRVAIAGSRKRAGDIARGYCEVHLWILPRSATQQAKPTHTWLATHEQAERLISEGAADKRDD